MVELRSRTHLHSQLHYIRAIKDGSIKVVLNVDAKGKSKLRFRQLVDVYNQDNIEDGDDDGPIPRVVRDLDNVSEMRQGSCLFGAELNPEDFSMTLEKIRKQCKEKKRKRKDTETALDVKVKQEHLTEDEGCDLEEPLSNWNTKFTKRRKKKQKRKAKCGSTLSRSVKKVDLPLLCDVKLEAWDDDSYSVSQAKDLVSTDLLLDCSIESESPTNTELVEDIIQDSSMDTRIASSCSVEPNSPGRVAIEETIIRKPVEEAFEGASEEFNDARKVQCCLTDNIALECQEIFLCDIVSREDTVLEVLQNSESEIIGCVKNSISSNTSSGCEEVKENEESNDSKPKLDMTITGTGIVKMEAPKLLATGYSDLPVMDIGVENTEILWESEDVSKDDLPEATDIIQLTNSLGNLDLTITGSEIVKLESPELLATGVENTEVVWESEDIGKDGLPEATDIIKLANCSNPLENLHSVPDDSMISLEEDQLPERLQQPASSGLVDEAGDHKSSQLCKVEVTTAAETDSIQQQELHNQPEKLLSGRKALSPTSQAKLRKAMEHPDSPEKRSKKSKGKLYFSSQSSHRILKAEGLDSIDRVDVNSNSKKAIQKANKTRQTQYQRAPRKFSRRDTQATKPQPFSSGCTSLEGCTQKAITFSQGQMRDFQYVAAKLTKELKSMTKITKRSLLAESNMSDSNFDEVKTLIKNAEKNEESSKKWLSMIERDCNRFCKLMGMVKEDSPATENIVHKKKKIKFADDAGGDLCHIKVFEIDLESES